MADEQTGAEGKGEQQDHPYRKPSGLRRRQHQARRLETRAGRRCRERRRGRYFRGKRQGLRRRRRRGAGFVHGRTLQKCLKIAAFKQGSWCVRDRLRVRRFGLVCRVRRRHDHLSVAGWTIYGCSRFAAGNAHELIAGNTAEADWHRRLPILHQRSGGKGGTSPCVRCGMVVCILTTAADFRYQTAT